MLPLIRRPFSLFVVATLGFLGACDTHTEAPKAAQREVTWYRDVLPIVQARCQACHTEDGIGPFPLMTYEEASSMHEHLAESVQSRHMPPWMPAAGCGDFRDSLMLTEEQIQTIVEWSESGARAGDPADAPPPPESSGASLPWIDATLDAGADYVPVITPDEYHCFILDPKLAGERDLVGIDIHPGNHRMVHHVMVYAAPAGEAQPLDDADPALGWTCFKDPVTPSALLVGGWGPGMLPARYPEGTGVPLSKGQILVAQVHYSTVRTPPAPDRTVVHLQYAKQRVPKPARIVPIANHTFEIPPGARGYSASATLKLPSDTRLFGLLPHMHGRGTRISLRTTGAGGMCLIDIPRWDFHWQQAYTYQALQGLLLPAGTEIELTCTWDNETDHPIRWGPGSEADEMCLNHFYMTDG
jgi:mono/diheme cytochrome c family protein